MECMCSAISNNNEKVFHMIEQTPEPKSPPQRATHISLTRGLQILELIAGADGPVTLSDTARALDLPRSTTHHIMQTLTQLGYLHQDDVSRTYVLGEKALRLTGRTLSTNRIAELALPLLKEICSDSGESAAIGALLDDQVTLIATHDADGPVRVVQDVGAHRPIHGTALGKVLAAWLPAGELSRLLATMKFEELTPKTIVQRQGFETELLRVRSAGMAFDNEEYLSGVRCVAAPVFGPDKNVVAALGLTGPRHRLPQRKMREFSPLVQRYADELSKRLSNVG